MSTGSASRLNKRFDTTGAAIAGLESGASVMIGGFSGHAAPDSLLRALIESGARNLTVICQGTGVTESAQVGIDSLVAAGRVKKIISPLPFDPRAGGPVKERWEADELELEVLPAGVLTERIRSGGAGIGGSFIPAGAGTRYAEGGEVREFNGRPHIFQPSLKADFALLRASTADSLGNLIYIGTQRNWSPIMAMAARVSVVEVDEIVETGRLDPERIITPAIFVQRLVLSAS